MVGSRKFSRTIRQHRCRSGRLLYAEGASTVQNRVEDQLSHDESAGVVTEVICGVDPRLKASWPGAPAGPQGIHMTAVSHTCSDSSSNTLLAQTLDVRFFEVAEQLAGPRATRAGAKPTGCKQPVGSVTASAPRCLAGPGTR